MNHWAISNVDAVIVQDMAPFHLHSDTQLTHPAKQEGIPAPIGLLAAPRQPQLAGSCRLLLLRLLLHYRCQPRLLLQGKLLRVLRLLLLLRRLLLLHGSAAEGGRARLLLLQGELLLQRAREHGREQRVGAQQRRQLLQVRRHRRCRRGCDGLLRLRVHAEEGLNLLKGSQAMHRRLLKQIRSSPQWIKHESVAKMPQTRQSPPRNCVKESFSVRTTGTCGAAGTGVATAGVDSGVIAPAAPAALSALARFTVEMALAAEGGRDSPGCCPALGCPGPGGKFRTAALPSSCSASASYARAACACTQQLFLRDHQDAFALAPMWPRYLLARHFPAAHSRRLSIIRPRAPDSQWNWHNDARYTGRRVHSRHVTACDMIHHSNAVMQRTV